MKMEEDEIKLGLDVKMEMDAAAADQTTNPEPVMMSEQNKKEEDEGDNMKELETTTQGSHLKTEEQQLNHMNVNQVNSTTDNDTTNGDDDNDGAEHNHDDDNNIHDDDSNGSEFDDFAYQRAAGSDFSYLKAAGCNCDFKHLLAAQTPEEFKNRLQSLDRMTHDKIFSNGIMLEVYVRLREHVVDELMFEFVKTIIPLHSLPLMQNQTPRQFTGKAKRFRRQLMQRRKSRPRDKLAFQQYLNEPYSFTISEKRRSAIKEGQQRSRDLAEERERSMDVDVLTSRLEEAREKLLIAQHENDVLSAQLKEVSEERDAYKEEMDRMKKENLEIHLKFSI